jgi:GDP-4-dehydro-6-deoxy-D-mannose reductase
MKKVLITGATGFVGKHLINHLVSIGTSELYGTTLSEKDGAERIKLEKVDLKDYGKVLELIEKIKPDQIYHLAAFTSPADSFSNPASSVLGNIEIQLNVLNALKECDLKGARTLVVSSAEVYGMVDGSDLPIRESTEFRPVSPYGVSKIAQDYLALQYFLSHKMDIIRVRPFNHIGPGQSNAFSVASFSEQIARIEKKLQEPVLKVGNLAAKRDFTDVRDIVRGYALLMEKGKSGEVYNIGSGRSHSIHSILEKLLALSSEKIEIENDPDRARPSDIPDIYCDMSKISLLTGWKPEIELAATLKDTLDYWRSIV